MKIGILQLNFKVGAFAANLKKIQDGYHKLVEDGAELVVCSELALFGYPPGDMLFRHEYLDAQDEALKQLSTQVGNTGLLIGVAVRKECEQGLGLFNSAVLIRDQKIIYSQDKILLPNYDVFDDRRYFDPGSEAPQVIDYEGSSLGVLICEDIWSDHEIVNGHQRYSDHPHVAFRGKSLDMLLTINASPFYQGKMEQRQQIAAEIAQQLACSLLYVNQVGGNDELVFDGNSFVLDADGAMLASAKSFAEDLLLLDTENPPAQEKEPRAEIQDLYDALILGARDYVQKSTGSSKVAIALSGGIDSAVTACLACEAMGPENLIGVGMPSTFSSQSSIKDAEDLARNLGIEFKLLAIEEVYNSFGNLLRPVIDWRMPGTVDGDVTEENIQARIRGTCMMAISNRFGGIVLSTGNKSEISLGYCTLYGDMAGGFSVLSDVLKTQVYELARYINRNQEVIPWSSINKPPSAELRPDQKDEDSLPPYGVLDPILDMYIEQSLDAESIIAKGYDRETVLWLIRKCNANEYKRRQMVPGLKVTLKAFGSGRRMPIAANL